MSFPSLLNQTCTIQEKTLVATGTGAQTKSWANKATQVPCSTQTAKGGDVSEEWAEKLKITHFHFFEINVNVVAGNKIIIGSIEYIVKRVDDAAGRGHHLEVWSELKP